MKNLIRIFAIWMLLLAGMEAGYAQFKQDSKRSLFSDVKAFEVGDAIMVLIVEETSANNSAGTNTSRSTDLSGGLNAGTGTGTGTQGKLDLNTGNTFKSSGQTTRTEQITSKLSAKVVEVDSKGNLKIEGKRTTKINGETQTITIQGYVRPVDVSPDNSVYSYNILDLTLLIEGNGSVSEIQEPGLILKFLRLLF